MWIILLVAVLAIAFIMISRSRKSAADGSSAAAATSGGAPAKGIDDEAYAVLTAAITEEARISGLGEVRIVSITEL